jgi:hypothetical protein
VAQQIGEEIGFLGAQRECSVAPPRLARHWVEDQVGVAQGRLHVVGRAPQQGADKDVTELIAAAIAPQ